MRTEILTQRMTFAEIEPYRDFSYLTDKVSSENTIQVDDDIFNVFSTLKDSRLTLSLDHPSDYKRKNTKYYYSGELTGQRIQLNPYLKKEGYGFLTKNDSHIKRHFGRPLSTIRLRIYERTISIKGDILTIKSYQNLRHRLINCKYFKKHVTTSGLSINLKTGDITSYTINSSAKGRVRKNVFTSIYNIIRNTELFDYNSILNSYEKTIMRINDNIKIFEQFKNEFDDEEFCNTLYDYLKLNGFDFEKPNLKDKSISSVSIINHLIEMFVGIKQIKTPNNYYGLISKWYPTKPFLVKNENKLVAAILDRMELKSKQTIKLVHKYPKMDIRRFTLLKKYFGATNFSKYVASIDERYFNCDYKDNWYEISYYIKSRESDYNLTKNEKSNLIKLLNLFVEENGQYPQFSDLVDKQITQLNDHFNMIEKVRIYYPDTEMRATNWIQFNQEHVELSKIERTIKKGYNIVYTFDDKMVNVLEEPIITNDGIFNPVILKTDTEYTEEGAHMHHCVATYVDKDRSIIISLRLNSHDRVTNEFNCHNKECYQSKSFCNASPPENFKEALEILKERVLNYKGSIHSTGKKKIPLVINGITVGDVSSLLPVRMMDEVFF